MVKGKSLLSQQTASESAVCMSVVMKSLHVCTCHKVDLDLVPRAPQCLAHSRHIVNICGINEVSTVSPHLMSSLVLRL